MQQLQQPGGAQAQAQQQPVNLQTTTTTIRTFNQPTTAAIGKSGVEAAPFPTQGSRTIASQRMKPFHKLTPTPLLQLLKHHLKKISYNDNETIKYEYLQIILDGMGYQYRDNNGRGNCFYLALADQLQIDSTEIRSRIADWLRENREYTSKDGTVDLWNGVEPERFKDWEDFIVQVKTNTTSWAEWPCLVATAEVFKSNLHIISDRGEGYHTLITPKDQTNNHLVLGHIAEVHYVSVHETEKPQLPDPNLWGNSTTSKPRSEGIIMMSYFGTTLTSPTIPISNRRSK